MGFCRLLKIILHVSAVALLAAGTAAEIHQSTASATIQVTATVVPSVGLHAPDDVLLVSTRSGGEALGLYQANNQVESSSPPGQLLMHYPSSGVLLSINDGSAEEERLSFDSASQGPGARLVDLERIYRGATAETGDITLTVIYTEN